MKIELPNLKHDFQKELVLLSYEINQAESALRAAAMQGELEQKIEVEPADIEVQPEKQTNPPQADLDQQWARFVYFREKCVNIAEQIMNEAVGHQNLK